MTAVSPGSSFPSPIKAFGDRLRRESTSTHRLSIPWIPEYAGMTDDRRPHIIRGVWPPATPPDKEGWNCVVQRAFRVVLETHTNDLRVALESYDHE